ncbi:MAG TPA: FAD-binding oxidoreductase [Acidimicrobiales bacterium]|jgi:alkyldihydroxyacetonephosphate synthase|nr:FAD-binding oxidoreductase [Acidimicrobiales bacterium]
MNVNRGAPTPAIAFDAAAGSIERRLSATVVDVDVATVERLQGTGATVTTDDEVTADTGRDWWPLAMAWALDGAVPGRASVVVRPEAVEQIPDVLRICSEARLPVTTAAGRSGVCGASVPVHGGVLLDMIDVAGIIEVDDTSLLARVRAGTFGDVLEEDLRADHGVTLGHWPQSVQLSTVGGWVACRSAGQYSTRYGKIEDMVTGLEVVLADGRVVRTGSGGPRAAVGPDLNQIFIGSEGTLGVITEATLRVHPAPSAERVAAFGFGSFVDGLDACRRILRRGATPAVLRLYDEAESKRNFDLDDTCALLVLDEADAAVIDGVMAVVTEECAAANRLEDSVVDRWMEHRNDVSALEALIRREIVVDTIEIAGRWAALGPIYDEVRAAVSAVEHTLVVSAHQSHAYSDGACLYFTFAGRPPVEERDRFYVAVWDAATNAVLARGGALSHHHGVGLNRARFVRKALGPAFDVLVAMKQALDPKGILNPGKLGLPDPFGEVAWP